MKYQHGFSDKQVRVPSLIILVDSLFCRAAIHPWVAPSFVQLGNPTSQVR